MKEVKHRPSPISGEILDAWINVYEKSRKRGLAPKEAREYANVRTSFQATQDWLDMYAVARWEGLSEELAMSFSNAGALEDRRREPRKVEESIASSKVTLVKPDEQVGAVAAGQLESHPSQGSSAEEQDKVDHRPLRGIAKRLHISHR